MNDTVRTDVIVQHEDGLNAYDAARIVRTASRYDAEVRLRSDGRTACATDFLSVMSLGIVPGTVLTLMARGHEACAALHALKVLLLSACEVGAGSAEHSDVEGVNNGVMALVA